MTDGFRVSSAFRGAKAFLSVPIMPLQPPCFIRTHRQPIRTNRNTTQHDRSGTAGHPFGGYLARRIRLRPSDFQPLSDQWRSHLFKVGVAVWCQRSVCVCVSGWRGYLHTTNPADHRENLKLLNKAAKCVRSITEVT